MANRPVKLALTGAHGTGKTTLARRLAEHLQQVISVVVTPEVPRLIIQEVGVPSFFRRGQNTYDRQLLILARQLEEEAVAAASGAELVICDRTLIDHWAYTRVLFPEAVGSPEAKQWEALVLRWSRSYHELVRLPPEFPPVDDGIREGSQSFQAAIDVELLRLYAVAGLHPGTACGSVEQRVDYCVSRLKRRLRIL